jgi:hypothetical protein
MPLLRRKLVPLLWRKLIHQLWRKLMLLNVLPTALRPKTASGVCGRWSTKPAPKEEVKEE